MTFGDRTFDNLLGKAKKKRSNKLHRLSLRDDGPKNFDQISELRTETKFCEELDKMPRLALLDRVKISEKEKKNLLKRIDDLEGLIIEGKNILNDQANQEVM